MSEHTIRIVPHKRDIVAADGSNLSTSLAEHSIFLRSDCGGKGVCGKCLVTISGSLTQKQAVKACMTEVTENLSLTIPESSLLSAQIAKKPPVVFPESFRHAITGRKQGIPSYGIAVDLGTTTIALYLCELSSGSIISSLSIKNPQAIYGDDVMSRISLVGKTPNNLGKMQRLVVNAIEWGCAGLLKKSDMGYESIERMVAVGNPAMVHFFLGIDPQSIGSAPYLPAFFEDRITRSTALSFKQLDISVVTLPQISGFIGGDILAAAIAAELLLQPAGTLLIDIGTNGELIYKGEHGIYATSCATGPAFEGASISCGIQAIPEAIDKVTITSAHDSPQYRLIKCDQISQARHPAGLCGSGVVSAVAELYRTNIVKQSGAFIDDPDVCALQKERSGAKHYVIAEARANHNDKAVFLNQKDIRSIQLGKAALITGIEFLLKQEGALQPEKILIGGAFGSYLDTNDMIALGMIPAIDHQKIEIKGNLAGAGAVMALCDSKFIDTAKQLSTQIHVIELATNTDFHTAFVDNLHFPE